MPSHVIIKAVCLLVPRVNKQSVFGIRKWKCAVGVEWGNDIDGVEFVLPARNDMGWLRSRDSGWHPMRNISDGYNRLSTFYRYVLAIFIGSLVKAW